MSARIRILPENLTNKIAAGEVVERPASVVKELVENALDAGAGEVVVEIEAGGKRLIRVADNGSGMSREDALLSLERHATSKIASDGDLFRLATLGFRGEALPSVASVSRFTLATREEGRIEGTEIYAEGGRIREVKACGMDRGTVVSVRNLFFNTPARLKFLKSTETETGHVGEFLTRLAISRPEVRFSYLSDGRTVFRALDGDLRERVASLLGRTLAGDLYPVEFAGDGVSVTGLVAPPGCSRSSASHLYTYINGRFIRDRVVQHAVLQAYRNFMERGRYPVVVLFVRVSPEEVDVNVHPTKHEVRFREQGRVHDAIQAAVESVLRETPWIRSAPALVECGMRNAECGVKKAKPDTPYSALRTPHSAFEVSAQRVAEVREALVEFGMRNAECGMNKAQAHFPHSALRIPHSEFESPHSELKTQNSKLKTVSEGYFSSLTIIGQFNAAYILCQDGSDLVIIDQHAAHERVAFEQLKKQFAEGGGESQGLLFPETVELSFREGAIYGEHGREIARLGFELEPFGGSTWLLKGVPRLLAGKEYLRILRDILEELEGLGRSGSFADAQEEILTRIACHSVVRGSHSLTTPEIRALLARMDAAEFSSNCPHGRPVFRKIGLGEIERMFKRS